MHQRATFEYEITVDTLSLSLYSLGDKKIIFLVHTLYVDRGVDEDSELAIQWSNTSGDGTIVFLLV